MFQPAARTAPGGHEGRPYNSVQRVSPTLAQSLVHRHHISDGHAGLNVVNSIENEAPAGAKGFQAVANSLRTSSGVPKGKVC